MNRCIYLVFFFYTSFIFPQQGTYLKLYGFGSSSGVLIEKNGNYILTGGMRRTEEDNYQIMIMKTTPVGDSIYQKFWHGTSGYDVFGRQVIQTVGGNYIVSSNPRIKTPTGVWLHDIGLSKFGPTGDSIFYRQYDINQARYESLINMLLLTDSTLLILGVNGNGTYPSSTSFLILDTNGNVYSEKIFPPTLYSSSAFKYDNETIFVFGDEDTLVGGTHYRKLIILKTTINGDSLGTITLTPAHRSGGMGAVIRMADGSFALGTTYWDSLNIKKAVYRKIDAQGRMIWEWEALADNWRTTTMAPAPDTSIVLLQVTQLSKRQIRLSKINKNGALAWQRVIQLPSYVEYGEYASLAVAPDGYILVTGFIRTLWEEKVFLLKTTSEGYVNVGVEEEAEYQPQRFSLEQNYPNPFNPVTTIRYALPVDGIAVLKIYDILGNEIRTVMNEEKTTGRYAVSFSASSLPSGTYFYELRAGDYRAVKKMIILK